MFYKDDLGVKIMDKYMTEISIIKEIVDADFDEKLKIYHNYSDIINDYTITFVDEEYGKDNYRYMLDVLRIDSKLIFSPFHTNKLFTLFPGFVSPLSPLAYFYDISLDTSIVSYIDRFQRGLELETNSLSMVRELGKHRRFASTVNLSPYLNENCLFEGKVDELHIENIYNFFFYLNKFHHKFNWVAKRKSKKATELIVKNQELLFNSPLADRFKHQFKIIHSTMLKMALINLCKADKKRKILTLLDFMATDIKAMDICLLEISAIYFLKKQVLSFFGKVQKGNSKILETIRNLSWDIFHLRYQEFLLSIKPFKRADVNLVLFCTLDRRLLEIKEIIKLKAVAYNSKTLNYYPFYHSESVLKLLSTEEISKYFNANSHFDRISTKMGIDYDALISDLEREVEKEYSK
jgi:hypothetical protein